MGTDLDYLEKLLLLLPKLEFQNILLLSDKEILDDYLQGKDVHLSDSQLEAMVKYDFEEFTELAKAFEPNAVWN